MKKINIKYLGFFLICILGFVFALVSTKIVHAATAVDSNGISWTYTLSKGKATSVKPTTLSKLSGIVVVPNYLNGYPVNDLYGGISVSASANGYSYTYSVNYSGGAFKGNTAITSVVLPSTLTKIGPAAFYGCTNLNKIEIPDSVTIIGAGAFKGCTSLTSIIIPSSVTEIGYSTFEKSGLRTVTFNGNVMTWKELGQYDSVAAANSTDNSSFRDCTSLTDVNFIGGMSKVASYLFDGCISLSNINFLNGVTKIGIGAFRECTAITEITLPSSITALDDNAFKSCTNLSKVTLSQGLLTIDDYAFKDCVSLTNITIPSSLTRSSQYAFANCSSLSKVIIYSKTATLPGWTYNGNKFSYALGTIATVYGYNSSTSQVWANTYGRTFVPIDGTDLDPATKIPNSPVIALDTTLPSNSAIATITYPSEIVVKQYRLGFDGSWLNYTEPIVINSNTTIYAKGQNLYGTWSKESSFNVTNIKIPAVIVATEALVKAEGTYLQSDLDAAKVLINALPDSNEKSDLMKRADNLQKAIDNNKEIIILADSDEVMRLKMVNLTIKTQDLTDLYTIQLELKYDPEKLELDQTNIKNLAWDNSSNGYSAIKADPGTGVVKLIYSRKGNNLGVNQVNDLISVPFKALKIGKTTVEVNKFKVTNSQGIKLKESNSSFKKEINIIPNPLNIVVTGDKGQNDWYISPVTVEVNSLDAKEINYSIDGTQHSYTQPFTIQEIGEHRLVATIDDGNGYTDEKEQEINIDFESPEISLSSHRNNKQSELNRMPVLDTQMNAQQQYELNMVSELNDQVNNWQNEINVTPSVNDQDGSGLSKTWYQWSNTDEQPEQWEEYQKGELTQITEGTWYLHIKAMDMAGNISQNVFGPYNVERIAPIISVDNTKREAWAATDVTVLPTFSDEGGSQLKKMGYLWSLEKDAPSEYTTYSSGSLSQSKDGSWYLHLLAEDGAGNMKTMTYGPYNIDKNAPVIEFSDVSDGTDYTDSVTPIIAISDVASGIKSKTILLDGDDYVSGTPIIERGVHTITATAEDFIGNITTKSVTFTVYNSTTLTLNIPQVDVNDPYTITATLTAGSQSVTGSAISVTGSAISISGAAISIKLNGKNMGTYYTDSEGKVTLSGIHSLPAGSYAVDTAYLPEESQYLVASQGHSSLTVTSANNKLSNTEKYQLLHPGELKIQATVSQNLDIKSEDISLAKFSIEILKVGKDDAATRIDTFVTECDSKGIIAFKRTYDKGDYKVNIKPLNEEEPATNAVSISVHVN